MIEIFLGGTCNGSKWRETLIPMLTCNYFNPVVDDWNAQAQELELKKKASCDYSLFFITPLATGSFSIAEAVDMSNKHPERCLFGYSVSDTDVNGSEVLFSESQLKSLVETSKIVSDNGGKVFDSLNSVAEFLNTAEENNSNELQVESAGFGKVGKLNDLLNGKIIKEENDCTAKPGECTDMGEVSDGYHTFNELYKQRSILAATIFNLLPEKSWKSKNHHDPMFPMYDGMFIVGIETEQGQATYHIEMEFWDAFHVKELERPLIYDGHTPDDALKRIASLTGIVM